MFANTLTELSVVPAIVLGLRAIGQRPASSRMLKAVALVCGMVLVGMMVFGDFETAVAVPGLPRTPTVLLLPLLFWAAVRFGVGGVSTALLVSAW